MRKEMRKLYLNIILEKAILIQLKMRKEIRERSKILKMP